MCTHSPPRPLCPGRHRAVVAGLLAGALLLLPSPGHAADPGLEAPAEGERPVPYRGSTVTLRNSATAVSLNRGAELTYNPAYDLDLSLDGRWWFGDTLYARGRFDLGRELTNADYTTYRGETLAGDLLLTGGGARLYEIPVAEVQLSASLTLRLPTSKAAQARTLVLGLEPTLGASRTFDVLGGLNVGYGFSPSLFLHRYTTAERDTPLFDDCPAHEPLCGQYMNISGARNTQWSHAHTLSVNLAATPWLSLTAAAGMHVGVLYPVTDADGISFEPQAPQDVRYTDIWMVEAAFEPMPALTVALGASTVNPHLAPDSTPYMPFFNRYARLYVDLRLNPAGLVAQLSSGGQP